VKLRTNFDNVVLAMLTLFQISTTELWVDVTFSAVDAVGVDQQPVKNHNPAVAVFFVLFMIFGCFFILQLFISVTLEKVSEHSPAGIKKYASIHTHHNTVMLSRSLDGTS
jgi:hypothetical protein